MTGQIEGGAVQGLGQALSEAVVCDRDSGQPLTAGFQKDAMPRADIASGFFKMTHVGRAQPALHDDRADTDELKKR